MEFASVSRYIILIGSGAVMVLGTLVMAGLLVPRHFPSNYGIVIGAVVFLYGAYRFAIAYFRKPQSRRNETS